MSIGYDTTGYNPMDSMGRNELMIMESYMAPGEMVICVCVGAGGQSLVVTELKTLIIKCGVAGWPPSGAAVVFQYASIAGVAVNANAGGGVFQIKRAPNEPLVSPHEAKTAGNAIPFTGPNDQPKWEAAAARIHAAVTQARQQAGPIANTALSDADMAKLKKLANLHAAGALTDEEFAAEKRRIVPDNDEMFFSQSPNQSFSQMPSMGGSGFNASNASNASGLQVSVRSNGIPVTGSAKMGLMVMVAAMVLIPLIVGGIVFFAISSVNHQLTGITSLGHQLALSTVAPTSTPEPTGTPVPLPTFGAVLLDDHFADVTTNGWCTGTDISWHAGVFQMSAAANNVVTCNPNEPASGVANLSVTTTFRQVSSPTTGDAVIVVRYQDDNDYMAFFDSPDAEWSFSRLHGGTWTDIAKGSDPGAPGVNGEHQMTLIAFGDHFNLSVDGHNLGTYRDSTYAGGQYDIGVSNSLSQGTTRVQYEFTEVKAQAVHQ